MRYLWFISSVMVIGGLVLTVASVTRVLGPAALLCGALLLCSGIVKVIVLKIWHGTLYSHPAAPSAPAASSGLPDRRPSS